MTSIYKKLEQLGLVLFATAGMTGITAFAQQANPPANTPSHTNNQQAPANRRTQSRNQQSNRPGQTSTTTTQSQTTTTTQNPPVQNRNNSSTANMKENMGSANSPGMVRQAQRTLKNDGLYNGRVDGIDGPHTRTAIRNYQKNHNLAVTGRLDQATANSMGLTSRSGNASRSSQD